MSYKKNWLRHFFAGLAADGSKELDRDFWSNEDIWNPFTSVRYRWLKLIWVCFASTVTQIVFPGLVMLILSSFFMRSLSIEFVILFTGGLAIFGTFLFFLIQVIVYNIALYRMKWSLKSGSSNTSEQEVPLNDDSIVPIKPEQKTRPITENYRQKVPLASLVVSPPKPIMETDGARLERHNERLILVVSSSKASRSKFHPIARE